LTYLLKDVNLELIIPTKESLKEKQIMSFNNLEGFEKINSLLQAVTNLQIDLVLLFCFECDFKEKWPEIHKIFLTEEATDQINLVQKYPGVLNSEENGELEHLKAQISSFLRRMPTYTDLKLFEEQIAINQNKLYKKFMEIQDEVFKRLVKPIE